MTLKKTREQRRSIFRKVKLRSEEGWTEVTISNVSSRGLMLRCSPAPAKGAFIEVRHRGMSIVGQVMWSNGSRCGVRTQDKVDTPALLSDSPITPIIPGFKRPAAPTRRSAPKICKTPQDKDTRSLARMLDWSMVAAAAVGAAWFVADSAGAALEAPIHKASLAMQGL